MLRAMAHEDADAVVDLMDAAWGVPERPPAVGRVTHLIGTDPGGAWVTTDDGGAVDGAALALVREERLWGLSLLIVRADRQSAGIGGELMRAATAYGAGTPGGIILSSEDPRALRSYWRAGYELRPVFDAEGTVRVRPPADPAVREARWPADRELVDTVSRFVRGAAHGSDIDAQFAHRRRVLVHDDGGFASTYLGRVSMLAATDERIARALLRTVLHENDTTEVHFLDARQQWGIDEALKAGLALKPSGATCVRGDVGPMRPYIPSGAYL